MKGQVSSIDALIAILLFAGAYTFLTNAYSETEPHADGFDALAMRAMLVSSQLLSSQGEPLNWTQANVSRIGLVVNRGVVESDKLAAFLNLSQSNATRLNELLAILGYKFYLNVSHLNGSTLLVNEPAFNGQALAGSDFNSTMVVSVRSVAVYNGSTVFVNIKFGE